MFTMSLFSDINTWDVGTTLENVGSHSPIYWLMFISVNIYMVNILLLKCK